MDKLLTELPVWRLGLVGFPAAEQALLEAAIARNRSGLRWRLGSLAGADALCAKGAQAVTLPDGSVQIASCTAGAPPVRLDLNDSDRPVAFSLPASRSLPPSATFDLRSPGSTQAMLEKFEGWLRPVAVQFWLASRIVQERLDVSSTVFHVSVNGRLQAVVSRRNGIGVLPIADPALLHGAIWARRPGPADEIPGHFVRTGLTEALWRYAMRTTRDLLPSYLRSGPIYWCRAPQIPQRMFKDSHLMIGRELAHAPATFTELGKRTGVADADLARDLAALRIVGAITHDKKQALRAAAQQADNTAGSAHAAGSQYSSPDSKRSDRSSPAGTFNDKTAPAPLMRMI